MTARARGLGFVLLSIDVAESGALGQLQFGLCQAALRLSKIGRPLLTAGPDLSVPLFHLMAQILELGLCVPGGIHLRGGIKSGDEVPLFHLGPVGDELGQRQHAGLTLNPGN